MVLDATFFAVAIPVVLFAGIDKAGFGSAASVAATAFLSLILTPEEAVAIMLPLLIAMDFVALKPNWRKWEPRVTKIMLIGSLTGAFLGAGLVFVVSSGALRFLIGAIALIFVAYQFARRNGWLAELPRFPDPIGYLFAAGAGITSFVAHAGGPVASIYLLSAKLTKDEYQATTIIVFWLNNLVKVGLYLMIGLLSLQTSLASIYLLPFAVIGTLIGVKLNKLVPERLYFACIYVFLTIAGTRLMFDAFT